MADRRLQVFHAVAKNLSFTKAADALFMTQPAVTFQIRQLEEQFNTRLFERGHGHISLTAAGELMLQYASKILAITDEMESRIAELTGEMRGPLLVGASTTIAECMLPRVLGEFNALYPQARVRLVVGNSEAIESRVAENSVDVGFVEAPVKSTALGSEAFLEDEMVAICAPDYPLAHLAEVTPKGLRDYEFIAREPGSGTREITEAYFRNAGVPADRLKILVELGSPEALKGVVGTGLGFAIVPRSICEKEERLGTLAVVSLKPRLKRSLFLVYSQDRFRSRLSATFMDFAKRSLREMAL